MKRRHVAKEKKIKITAPNCTGKKTDLRLYGYGKRVGASRSSKPTVSRHHASM